jgi:hypothetical protein
MSSRKKALPITPQQAHLENIRPVVRLRVQAAPLIRVRKTFLLSQGILYLKKFKKEHSYYQPVK